VGYTPPPEFTGIFRDDDVARAVYSEAAGIARILPTAVGVPRDAADVAALMRWSAETGVAIIPRGSGSGMAGGSIGSGVVVDLSRLRGVGDPDVERRSLRAQVGVLRGELQRRAASRGLRFPVDPSSGEFCTIGGMTATNAAGAHSLRYGSMRPWVLAIDCVFADGSTATVRRGAPPPDVPAIERFMRDVHPRLLGPEVRRAHAVLKDSSGFAVSTYAESGELLDLLVGSEGTLALFTAAEVALIPAVSATASMLVAFRDLDAAVTAAVDVRDRNAAACELLDRTFLAIAARGGHALPVPADTEAVLMIELEGADSSETAAAAESLAAFLARGGANVTVMALERARELELWSFRHAASPALAQLDPSLRSMQFIEDAAVPPDRLAEYVRGVRRILSTHDTPGVIFGHAGDAHVHVNPLVDVQRTGWHERIERILLDTTELVAQLGGTLTGEHGDGRLRTPLLRRVWNGAALAAFSAIKRAFDPENRLNPGVKVALPEQRAVDIVKYDPTLPAHPARARVALDTVERERAYSRFRLDLV
jgi:FAD/FMN-containing dehydrogenase